MEDSRIVELFWRRDTRALSECETAHGEYLRSLAGRFVERRDAEECVNDAYLRAWNAIPPAKPGKLRAFLGKITRNLAIDALRRGCAQKRGGEAESVSRELELVVPDSALDAVSAEELAGFVDSFLRTLPRRDRDIMIRRCFFAESVAEIAAKYAMRANTVSVSLSRSRKKLADYLRKEGLYE